MKNTTALTEIALFAALGIILDLLSGLVTGAIWLFGGSISLGVIPIFIVSFRRGLKAGLLTGFIVGMLQLVIGDPYIVHPVQFIFDYIFAYTVIGVSGITAYRLSEKKIVFGVLIGITGRFLMHFIAGVVFFAEYAEGQPVIRYSLIYNATYLLPTLILSIFLLLTIFEINDDIFEAEAY